MNKLMEETKIFHDHFEWLSKNLFVGPRWITLKKYKWKRGSAPIDVSYYLSWSGAISTVWAEVEIKELGELSCCGRTSQHAHDRLVEMISTSGLNRKYIPWDLRDE